MRLLFLVLFLSCALTLPAQKAFNSLEDAIAYGRQNNPSLAAENLNVQISQERVRSAWSSLLPTVRAFGTLDNNLSLPIQLVPAQFLGGQEGQFARVQFGTQFSATYGAEANLSLINVAQWKNVKASAYAQDAARHQLADRQLNITEQIITAYYFSLLTREAIGLNTELLNAADSLLTAATVRLKNGTIEPLEYNRAKSLFIETSSQLEESRGAFVKNLNTLKALVNINESDTLILGEKINTLQSGPSSLTIQTHQLPRYMMYQSRQMQNTEELKRQQSRIFPELSAYARYTRQAYNNEFKVFSSSQTWFDVSVIGLKAEWNLFSGFARQSSIRQASLQSRVAQLELENYSRQAERELQELVINHQVAADGLKKFEEHFRLNTMNHRIAGDKYSEGVYTIDQYVTIYQERVQSQNQYLNKLANFLVYESMIQSRNLLK